MSRIAIACVVLVGCGSSAGAPQAKTPAETAKDAKDRELTAAAARDAEIAKLKPEEPFETRDRTAYQPTERCGQGPYRFETDTLHAKYGEEMIVYACGKRPVRGNYRISSPSLDHPREAAFGLPPDWAANANAACKGRVVATATVTDVSSGGGSTGTGSSGGGGGTAGAKAAPIALAKAATATARKDCAWETQILDQTWNTLDATPVSAAHYTIDVWSPEPNDLEGLTFVVERKAVVADMTPERWKAYRAAWQVYYDTYMANLARDVASGRTTLTDSTVTSPPPPPPRGETKPPKPSEHARWIPGYWVYDAAAFHWLAGMWDVPDDDVRRSLTVTAPTPPPDPVATAEVRDARPTATAVWTPGGWAWDGRGYVWIAGAWRIPPDADHRWIPASWQVRPGRSTYIPGGWHARRRP